MAWLAAQVENRRYFVNGPALRFKAIDKVVFTARGCVEDQPQHPETAQVPRLVPLYPHTAALRARHCQWPRLAIHVELLHPRRMG